MKIAKIFLLPAAVLGLSACATITKNDLNYQFKKNATNGLAALAVECVGAGMVDIHAKPETNPFLAALLERNLITVNCTDGATSYQLINLPPGKYVISNIAPTDEFAMNFEPIKFSILQGKVNYIGHLKIVITPTERGAPQGRLHWTLYNGAHDEVPIFQAKFLKISPRKYIFFGK